MRHSIRCTCGNVLQIAAVEEQPEEIRSVYQDILPKMLFVCPACGRLIPSDPDDKPDNKSGITGGRVVGNNIVDDIKW